ncbi:pyroglutamyl peptidase [Streptomyces sp. PSAA01]|uniref:pyroglutamyl peptidase n=1 Tax=Streptomyces sp. PSAA01 TaxID=2912762 RepID=UPI001F3CBDB6|nr:pyroglutamyl peptidase [Streptomyces sp. PSAA01]MCG0287702.1 pyroglutamyl peptidase [Streptomyces sp. PSAA01]
MRPIRPRLALLGAALLAAAPLALAVPATAAADTTATPTVEEQRLDKAAPQEILRRSGFDDVAPDFTRALAGVRSPAEAERVIAREGGHLWKRAVDRVQGRGPAGGDLSRDDDRPLYWARLGMTRALGQWRPGFPLTDARRGVLLTTLERTSRGEDSLDLPAGQRIKRIVVTGFDPFQLDADVRRSNPSGAAALALDGTTIRTDSGPARVETAVFPVRWADFADGTVERTLLPAFRSGPRRVNAFMTVSQGRVGQFDVERTNGAWRGGYPDNANISRTETVPIPSGVPTPRPQPQWTTTTLPYDKIVSANTGPVPVYDHKEVTEIPAGATTPVVQPNGPTPGSTARAGGGGNYLSNEIAYRATLVRDALGLKAPGGHLHTPVLQFGPGNTDPTTGQVTDPDFVHNREAITAQVRSILTVVAATTR